MNKQYIRTDPRSIRHLCNSLNAAHIEALHRKDKQLSDLLLQAQGTIKILVQERQAKEGGVEKCTDLSQG